MKKSERFLEECSHLQARLRLRGVGCGGSGLIGGASSDGVVVLSRFDIWIALRGTGGDDFESFRRHEFHWVRVLLLLLLWVLLACVVLCCCGCGCLLVLLVLFFASFSCRVLCCFFMVRESILFIRRSKLVKIAQTSDSTVL